MKIEDIQIGSILIVSNNFFPIAIDVSIGDPVEILSLDFNNNIVEIYGMFQNDHGIMLKQTCRPEQLREING